MLNYYMSAILKPVKAIDTRQQIIDVAKTIILGKGFSAVGLNEILTAANVPKGSFYHYFASKETFGKAMLEGYFNDYIDTVKAVLQNANLSHAERLSAYFSHWLSTQLSDTKQDKCLVVKLSGEVTDLSEAMRQTLQKGTQNVIDLLQACIDEGVVTDALHLTQSPETIAKELYYMWLGATLMTKVNHTREALDCAMQATKIRLNIQSIQ